MFHIVRETWMKSAMASVMTLNDEESKVEESKKKDNRRKVCLTICKVKNVKYTILC